jgi:hypothetical protein
LGPVAIVGSKWGISTAGDVRTGAKVLLHSNGNPVVIAKEIEKGRVIWSGINSMMRIEGGKNENTNKSIKNIIEDIPKGKNVHVFCGHTHEEKSMEFGNIKAHCCKASFRKPILSKIFEI